MFFVNKLTKTKHLLSWYILGAGSILVSQFGMDRQIPSILLIFGTLFVGSCGGYGGYLPFYKSMVISQMSIANEYTDNFFTGESLILDAHPSLLFRAFHYETPCMARANLNKSVWLVTNTTAASKYIPRRPRICIN